MKNAKLLITAGIIVMSIFAHIQSYAVQEGGWKQQKDEDSIRVYTRKVTGSKYHEFKAETIMPTSAASIIAVLKDVEHFTEWMPGTKEAKLLEKSDAEQMHYLVSNSPWPVKDRDCVYHFIFSYDPGTQVVSIQVEGMPNHLPEEKRKVRIPWAIGGWTLTPEGKQSVHVVHYLHVEPGGNVAAGMANRSLAERPFKLLKSLRERVKLPQYQNAKYAFLVE